MEYRNSGNASHLGKGLAVSVDADAGMELLGSTLQAIGDTTASNLTIKAKGTGTLTLGDSSNVVQINGSTVAFKLVAGVSSYTPPALSSFAQDVTTLAMAGLSTGDQVLCVDFRGALSTKYFPAYYYPTPSATGELTIMFGNLHNSSVSASSGRVRWTYIDRT